MHARYIILSLHTWSCQRTGEKSNHIWCGTNLTHNYIYNIHIIHVITYLVIYIAVRPGIFYIETIRVSVRKSLMDTMPKALFRENVKQIRIIVSVCAERSALFRKRVYKTKRLMYIYIYIVSVSLMANQMKKSFYYYLNAQTSKSSAYRE